MIPYDFKTQLAKGKEGEELLDDFFKEFFYIYPIPLKLELKEGFDRLFIGKTDGKRFKIEYKTDYKAHKTGNAFIETISNDIKGKPGWIYTTKATFIIYSIPKANILYVIHPNDIINNLDKWKKQYRVVQAFNDTYCSEGILVPLETLQNLSIYTTPYIPKG